MVKIWQSVADNENASNSRKVWASSSTLKVPPFRTYVSDHEKEYGVSFASLGFIYHITTVGQAHVTQYTQTWHQSSSHASYNSVVALYHRCPFFCQPVEQRGLSRPNSSNSTRQTVPPARLRCIRYLVRPQTSDRHRTRTGSTHFYRCCLDIPSGIGPKPRHPILVSRSSMTTLEARGSS